MLAVPDLPQPGDAGAHQRTDGAEPRIRLEHVQHERARPHEAHVAAQYVEQLGQLVDAGAAEPRAGPGDATILAQLVEGAIGRPRLRRRIHDHGAELVHHEPAAAEAPPFLAEQDRARGGKPDDEGRGGQDRSAQRQPGRCQRGIQ